MTSSQRIARPAGEESLAATRLFLDRIFPPPRPFRIRLWDGTLLGERGDFTLVLHEPGALRRMFRPPVELSMGEAYLRREFEIEGDLIAAFELVAIAGRTLGSPGALLELARRYRSLPGARAPGQQEVRVHTPARLSGRVHTQRRDRAAVQYHYDVGNDFYQLFLDERMIYSCAYFPEGTEGLERAQERKLELICRKLRLRPGDRLLDVGCGWAGLLVYAAERYGVSGYGITLSEEQHRLGTERVRAAGLEGRVRIELQDYRTLRTEPFDRIVSVGMFEHVGRVRAPEYFERLFGLLREDGLFLNHAISSNPAIYQERVRGRAARIVKNALVGQFDFRKRYIFPDGELMPVSEANLHAEEAGFEVRDVESLREHYARTLRHWLQRLRARRQEAVALAGESMFRLWELYLAGSIHHFDTGRIGIHQSLFSKAARSCPVLPGSRADLYRSYERSEPELPAPS